MKKFNEEKLVQKLDRILKREFGTNISFREFSAGYGIADLVFASDFSFSKHKIQRAPIANFHALKILYSFTQERLYSKEEILSLGDHFERKNLIKQLGFLVKNDYLEKISKDTYKKTKTADDIHPIKKVIAIEVKLTDHKNGLIQAKRYRYFADESYLAILKSAEKHIDMNEFNKHNIGLILFDGDNNRLEIRYPEKSKIQEDRIKHYAKELMFQKFINLAS